MKRQILPRATTLAASAGYEHCAQSTLQRTSCDRQLDYSAFERLLGDIQTAYSAEDLSALRAMVTPEMLSYFSEELAANASHVLINRVTEIKLLQGDLAEAWREARGDYATVAETAKVIGGH
jgi:predicted lipid-binding transport protein (Tim44 family)